MKKLFADEELSYEQPSIFLAGPTPRLASVDSWRPIACELLDKFGFTGTVLIPERRDWKRQFDYLEQVEWEYQALKTAAVLAFWIPRDLETLPGFTTNVEFGHFVSSGRLLYGRPDQTPHTRYLDWLYEKSTKRLPYSRLDHTMMAAVGMAKGTMGTEVSDLENDTELT